MRRQILGEMYNKRSIRLHQFERNISIENSMDKIYELGPKICNPHNCDFTVFESRARAKTMRVT